jgi:hypothetical protein
MASERLSPEDKAYWREVDPHDTFQPKRPRYVTRRCAHCGGIHLRACPRIKTIEFAPSGEPSRVTFWKSWDDSEVIWPEAVFEDDEDETVDAEVVWESEARHRALKGWETRRARAQNVISTR